MARTGFFHHVGSFFLLAATVLLIVTSISAPVVNDIALLKVRLGNATADHDSALRFGTFGYCVTDTAAGSGHDVCSAKHVGYDPVAEVLRVNNIDVSFSNSATKAARALTKVMILHPVGAGVAFLAFLISIGAGLIGSVCSALVSLLAFVVAAVVLVTDFVLFHILQQHINDTAATTAMHATYGVGLWLLLAAAICLLLGAALALLTCCSGRLHSARSVPPSKAGPAFAAPAAPRRRRFF